MKNRNNTKKKHEKEIHPTNCTSNTIVFLFFSTSRFKDIYKSKEKEDVVFFIYSEILYLKEQNINTQLTKQKIQ